MPPSDDGALPYRLTQTAKRRGIYLPHGVDDAGNFRLPRHQGWCRIEWLLHTAQVPRPHSAQ
jgi:hypothetical protein